MLLADELAFFFCVVVARLRRFLLLQGWLPVTRDIRALRVVIWRVPSPLTAAMGDEDFNFVLTMMERPMCPQGHTYQQLALAEGAFKLMWSCDRCRKPHESETRRHICQVCASNVCFECLPPPQLKKMPTFLNPVTKEREPLLTRDATGQWIAPQFVEDMIALRFTYVSDAHKKMIQDCVHWTIPALKASYGSLEIKQKVRRLLGTFQYTQCLSWAQPSWPTLMDGLDREMGEIGAKLNKLYESTGLREILGTFVPKMLEGTNNRQDCPGGLVVPAFFRDADKKEEVNPLWRFEPLTIGHEIAYIHFLRLIATGITERFRDAVETVLDDLLVDNTFHAGGIKGYERMQNKLKSFKDHWPEEVPRPAENVDVVRGIACFNDPHQMRDGLERLQEAFGPFVKFKNGMAWSDAQAQAAQHLRLILASVRFTPRHPDTHAAMTFGDLCQDPRVRQKWEAYCSRDPPATRCIDEGIVGSGPWFRSIGIAMKWITSQELQNQTVTMVCEVQMLLQDYRDERHKMHDMYKVRRADNAVRLHADFVSSQKQELAEDELNKDSGMHKVNGVWRHENTAYAKLKRVIFHEREFLADRENPLFCVQQHAMDQCVLADGVYAEGWFCDRCGRNGATDEARHHCRTCCADVCYDCEPVAAEGGGGDGGGGGASRAGAGGGGGGNADRGFEDHLRGMMTQLQQLSLAQCAGLVSIACIYGKKHVVQVLVEMISQFEDGNAIKAMLDSSGCGYHFPLFNAAVCKRSAHRLDIMKMLINAKADPQKKTNGGCSSLWKAANSGYLDSAQFLLESKGDVNAMQESTTITPLYNACYRGHDEIAALLIEHKGNVNQVRKTTGATPLYTACENAHAPIVVTLIAHKADVNQCTTKNNSSPMYIAAQNGHLEIIHILAAAKANPHLGRTADGCTPLYAAADKGYDAIVEYINGLVCNNELWKCQCASNPSDPVCHCGINVLCQDNNWCPVNIAAYRGFFPCVRTLVELGANKRSISMGIPRVGGPQATEIREYLEAHLPLAP